MRAGRFPAVFLTASVVVFCIACGPRGPSETPEQPPAAPEEVVQAARGVVEQYRQAYQVMSFDAIAPLYAHTLEVALVHQGRHFEGWTAVEGYLKDVLSATKEIHIRIDNPNVVALGPGGAAVSAPMKRSISDGVATVDESGILTLALRREGDRWLIVKEHFSFAAAIE